MLQRSIRTIATLALAAAVLAGTFMVGTLAWATVPNVQAQAQEVVNPAGSRTITVVGEGQVLIQPDVARANFGVEVVRPTVREALDENKVAMDAILAALTEQGIEERDIQTTGFSIYAERFGPQGPLPEDEVNYRVSNNVTVIIRDLATVGTVVDAAVEAGANNIYGIEFRLDDPSVVESEARESAIADAKAKAEELAELTGVSLGEVVSISEVISNGYFASNFALNASMPLGGAATPISPGELQLSMQLQVSYAIGE